MKYLLILLGLVTGPAVAADDDWFNNDPYEQALAVNEGELQFLSTPPDKPAHHHENRLQITSESLLDGWVSLYQCHFDIDPVASSQILFREGRIRKLKVENARNIGAADVQGHSVQLQQVEADAQLCLSAETRALHRIDEHHYELRNGPYMRRFLDGFYPMRVTLDIHYPATLLLTGHSPLPQPGVRLQQKQQQILLDTWFEGILHTRFQFMTRP